MLICKKCGNYLNFHSTAYVVLENIIGKNKKDYEVNIEEEIQETGEAICTECEGKDSVIEKDINEFSENLKTELYDKMCNGILEKSTMQKVLKEEN